MTRRLAVLALMIAACHAADERPEAVSRRSDALVTGNGRSLNGRSLNGRSLNGRSLNGRSLNGRSLNGTTLDAVSARAVTLEGTDVVHVSLSATLFSGYLGKKTADQPPITGADFIGSVWEGVLSDGTTIPIRIDAIDQLPAPNSDLRGYAISYLTDDQGWVPYCGLEEDGTLNLAIPMAGTWSYQENAPGSGKYDDNADKGYTFACRHAAIAKCVEMGYRPWEKSNGKSLQPLTVACTRLLRADYCGTGVSYTVDGTLLDLNDRLEIQQVAEPTWSVEAEWGENGAVCLAPGSGDRFTNAALMPSCYAKLSAVAECGKRLDGPSLMVNRYAAPGQERFTGTWYGQASHGWGRVWMSLRQDGSSVTGAYVTDKNAFGSVNGNVLGRTLDLVLSTDRKGCVGTLVGNALVDADGSAMALDASGKDCKESLTLEVARQ
jgi:hypothetical protein